MDVTKIDAAMPEMDPAARRQTQPAETAKHDPAAPMPEKPASAPEPKDRVDVKSLKEASRDIQSIDTRAGKVYDYTVNSSHDLVIKVKELETRREVKQIPDKAYQAAKRAYHKVVDKIIDEEA